MLDKWNTTNYNIPTFQYYSLPQSFPQPAHEVLLVPTCPPTGNS